MKFKLKTLAAAAALVAASAAHADLTTAGGGNSTFALVAFNVVTNAYYVRDLGYTLNSFLPNSITTTAADGGGAAVTGDKTPETGTTLTFGGAGSFVSWLGSQNQTDIRWTVAAGDAQTTSGATNQTRALVAFGTAPAAAITNTTVRSAVAPSAGVSGLATQNNPFSFDATGATVLPSFLSNNSFGASTLASLGQTASLFYYATSTGTGSGTTAATFSQFANSANTATLTLASNGVLTYDLQPGVVSAVPVPAAAWLMGSGLVGLGGWFRRRKTAAAS